MKPTVYIANMSAHDFTPAEKFGKLVPLTEGYIFWDKVNVAHRQMVEALRHSHPEDLILISGPASISSIAVGIFSRIHGRVNLLVHDAEIGDYRQYTVVIDQLLVGADEHGANER